VSSALSTKQQRVEAQQLIDGVNVDADEFDFADPAPDNWDEVEIDLSDFPDPPPGCDPTAWVDHLPLEDSRGELTDLGGEVFDALLDDALFGHDIETAAEIARWNIATRTPAAIETARSLLYPDREIDVPLPADPILDGLRTMTRRFAAQQQPAFTTSTNVTFEPRRVRRTRVRKRGRRARQTKSSRAGPRRRSSAASDEEDLDVDRAGAVA
jgi:hypothetical protein